MNLRQKNKKLKQKLEWYQKNCDISKPVELYPSAEYEIRRFAATRSFPEEDVKFLKEDKILYLLAEDLLDYVKQSMEVTKHRVGFDDSPNRLYHAELTVAIPKTST